MKLSSSRERESKKRDFCSPVRDSRVHVCEMIVFDQELRNSCAITKTYVSFHIFRPIRYLINLVCGTRLVQI